MYCMMNGFLNVFCHIYHSVIFLPSMDDNMIIFLSPFTWQVFTTHFDMVLLHYESQYKCIDWAVLKNTMWYT